MSQNIRNDSYFPCFYFILPEHEQYPQIVSFEQYKAFSTLFQPPLFNIIPSIMTSSQPTINTQQKLHNINNIHHKNIIQHLHRDPQVFKEEIERKKLRKNIQSAKKNSESNIVNQLFLLLTSQYFKKMAFQVISCSGDFSTAQIQKISQILFALIRGINFKRGRKYVNRNIITKYYNPENISHQFPCIAEKLKESNIIDIDQLCTLFRKMSFYAFKNLSHLAILTSKRIHCQVKKQHLRRIRTMWATRDVKQQ